MRSLAGLWHTWTVMDGITGAGGGAMDIAANGISSIAMSVLAGTERLVADEAAVLMASLGVGSHFSASA
ncbi:MAG: hypothetical protein NVS4B13_08050 [Candidatus Elarobacter sp.]